MTISETIKALERIKTKYGDLQIYNVYYGSEVTEVEKIEPTVIKTTATSDDYVVIFQDRDD